jgi:hypothetical protein
METLLRLAKLDMAFMDKTGECLGLSFYETDDQTQRFCCNWWVEDRPEFGIIDITSEDQFFTDLQEALDRAFPEED